MSIVYITEICVCQKKNVIQWLSLVTDNDRQLQRQFIFSHSFVIFLFLEGKRKTLARIILFKDFFCVVDDEFNRK